MTNEKGEIKYVLQRINHLIFTNVDMLQNNIHVVTTHIRKKLEEKVKRISNRKVLTFLPTKDGKNIISMEIVIGGYAYSSLAAKAMRK